MAVVGIEETEPAPTFLPVPANVSPYVAPRRRRVVVDRRLCTYVSFEVRVQKRAKIDPEVLKKLVESAMSNPEQFVQLLQSLLNTENEIRSQAEAAYDAVPVDTRIWGNLAVIRNGSVGDEIRSLAAVLLRRLLSAEFEEFYKKLSAEQQAQLKAETLNCVTQDQPDVVRRKVCDMVGEVVRQMIDPDGNNQWPEFIQFLFNIVQSPNPELRISALCIFTAEPNMFGAAQPQYISVIKSMLMQNLADAANSKVQYAAARALCAFVKENEEDSNVIQAMSELANPLVHILHRNLEEGDDEILKSFVDIAETCPKFLRTQVPTLFELCMKNAADHDQTNEIRELSLEVLVTLCETAAAMVRKTASKYFPAFVQEILKLMCEIEEDPDWDTRDDDDDDESPSLYMAAEAAIDRIACGLGGKAVLNHVMQHIPALGESPDWKARHTALMAISAIGEGCQRQMSPMLPTIMPGVVNFLNDPHPRVRYACCNAIGQMCSDFAVLFQKKFHAGVVPGLLNLLENDPHPRVQAHAGAAIVNFAEDCPKSILSIYLGDLIAKLEAILSQKYNEMMAKGTKLVLEQVVTTIASVADTAQERFAEYYERFMPGLKYVVHNANDPNLKMLRGKTIEAISLIGLAVGKDKFMADAAEVMDLLLRTQTGENGMADDDPQLSFMIAAWARICKILGPDFARYLPMVMPPVMKAASMKPEVTVLDSDEMEAVNGHDDDWQFVSLGEQQNFGIRTAGLEDKATACQMLVCYARELGGAFAEYVPEVIKVMVPLLKFYFHDGVRTAAGESLPVLFESAKPRGVEYLKEMWAFVYPELLKALDQEPEHDVFSELMYSLAKCIDTLGGDFLNGDILNALFDLLEKTIKDHILREEKRRQRRCDEDYDEEVEERLQEDKDEDSWTLNRVSELLHSLFKIYRGDALFGHFDRLVPLVNKLLEPERHWTDRQGAICMYDDVIEYAGPYATKYQEFFLQPIIANVTDPHDELRQAAAYGVGVLAQFGGGQFSQYLTSALPRLVEVINDPEARTPEKIAPTENCIAAVAKILKYSSSSVAPEAAVQIIPLYLSWLPTWDDTEEAPHIYGYLFDLIEANHPTVMADVPAVVSIMAECLVKDALVDSVEARTRLVNILRQVQQDENLFTACLSRMTEEQKHAVAAALTQNAVTA